MINKMLKISTILFLVTIVNADNDDDGGFPPLFSFKDGNVGVNFFGFKASAGLGGLLNGGAGGGLHAEAETPFGQKAGAGLGGRVDQNGRSLGGLYAGATAGGGVGAAAGLGGEAGSSGSSGVSYAGASNGGVVKSVTKIRQRAGAAEGDESAGASGSFSASVSGNVQKSAPKYVEYSMTEEVQPQKTYVERTVIPNYVEKTIQVPSYVEKTVRVPTVVEKKVRVPAPPTVIEKTVAVPPKEVHFEGAVEEVVPSTYKVVQKTKFRSHPRGHSHYFRKRLYLGGAADSDAYAGGTGTYRATVRKTVNPEFINSIFNIPIATLGAVNQLVSGIAGGTSGSVSVSKSFSASTR